MENTKNDLVKQKEAKINELGNVKGDINKANTWKHRGNGLINESDYDKKIS